MAGRTCHDQADCEIPTLEKRYQSVVGDVAGLIDAARGPAARSVNAVMTAICWLLQGGGGERLTASATAGALDPALWCTPS